MLGFNDYLELVEDHTPTFAIVHGPKGEDLVIGCTCRAQLDGEFVDWQVHAASEIHSEHLQLAMYGRDDIGAD